MHGDRQTVSDIVARHMGRQTSCVETISAALTRAQSVQESCNAFTQIFEEEAVKMASLLDAVRPDSAASGLLRGVPICIKDMTPTAGHLTTCGSWATGTGETEQDAVIVQRLKAQGAIVIGKTTTAEYAFSSFTNTHRYGVTRNPWDRTRTSGGSSGGSAAAVAAGVSPLAEGTDMGGSVRIPAAACGIVGFKPSLGRIPMDILPNAFETFSHFGALAGSVQDAALFTAATAGFHPSDMLSRRSPFDIEKTQAADLRNLRIAASVDLGFFHVDPEVADRFEKTLTSLRNRGAIVDLIALPWTSQVFDAWLTRWNCLLALLVGDPAVDLRGRMHPELLAAVELGRATSATGLLAVDILRAEMNSQLNAIFAGYDAILCPTNAVPAPPAEMSDDDFLHVDADGKLHGFDMAHPFNMVPNCPVLSLPIGQTCDSLPVGMQTVGPPFADERTLSIAAAIEEAVGRLPIPKPIEITKAGGRNAQTHNT